MDELFLFSSDEQELIVQGMHNIISNCDPQSGSDTRYKERCEKIIAYIKSKEKSQIIEIKK